MQYGRCAINARTGKGGFHMSFYSYKNANGAACPGAINGNVINGLCQKLCVKVNNVYDAALSQHQLDEEEVIVRNIVPVLNCGCGNNTYSAFNCNCEGNRCNCRGGNGCDNIITHQEAVDHIENAGCQPLPQPALPWTFESCRSSTTKGEITNLVIDRLCDRPQYARVRCTVNVPVDVLFTDACGQEWIGQATIEVDKDLLLCIPEESIVPFTLESLVSAICVSGEWVCDTKFEINVCLTVVLKVLAEVEVMIPTYGFCEIPPAEEFAENVCDEFFSLPLFPQSTGCMADANTICPTNNTTTAATANGAAGLNTANTGCGCRRTCARCGTVCATGGTTCPRCGCMTTRT